MKRFVFAVLCVLSLFALSALAGDITGYITDAGCGAKQGAKAASAAHANCAAKCIKGGAAAVLVTEDGKVYKIAEQAKVVDHAGHKVTISGKLDGDTIKDIKDVKM